MIKIGEWLDKKTGYFIGRVYMLVLLFISNALIVVGAAMHYIYGNSIILLSIGVISTIILFSVI